MNRPAPAEPDVGPDLSDPFAAARAAALDELARPGPRRRGLLRSPLFDRAALLVPGPARAPDRGPGPGPEAQPRPADQHPVAGAVRRTAPGSTAPGWPRRPRWTAGRLPVAAAVVVACVALLAFVVLRRPPPADESLPRATAEPAAVDGSTTATTAGTVTVPAGSASGTESTTAASDGPVTVHVAGAVARPGVVALPGGSRVVDAVAAAGGMVPGADPDRVNLAAPLADGQRVVVPVVGQPPPAEVLPTGGGTGGSDPSGAGAGAGGSGSVDLNTADESALDALPGIGPATAQAIVAHREEAGPFASVDDLLDVRGIGDAKLEALRDLVTVGP